MTRLPNVRSSRICRLSTLSSLCVLVLSVVVTACDRPATGSGWAGSVDTLANGAIHVSSPAEGVWTDEDAWSLVETLRIGALEGGTPDSFGSIGDVAVDGSGSIYVLEGQAHEVRVFASDGTYLRTIGREGAGPGELDVSFGGEVLVESSGRVWVNNPSNRRWDLFSVEGESLGTTAHRTSFFGLGSVMGVDGTIYQQDRVRFEEDGDFRSVVLRREVEGDSLVTTDTLFAPPLPDEETVEVSFSNANTSFVARLPVPFVHQPDWSIDRWGRFWAQHGDGYKFVVTDAQGDTTAIIERDYEPVPVTGEELEEELERFTTGPLASGGSKLDRGRIPDVHPPISLLRFDSEGALWVYRKVGEGRSAWEVFNPEGAFLGEVRLPEGFAVERLTVHEITDEAVYAVWRDEFDLPYVVRFRIEKGF